MPTESVIESGWGVRSFAMGAVGAAAVVVVVYLALASAFLAYPDHPGTVFCQELYTRKDALAHEAQGERVLIVGGSGALFSVRAEMIGAATGIPALNSATHAGLGAPYLLDRAAGLVRPGDRVLLVPEHAYWHARAEHPFDDDLALRYVLTFDRGYLSDLGFPRGLAALLRAPTSDVLSGRDNARWRSEGSLLRDANHYPVSRLSRAGDLELRTERRRAWLFTGVGLLPPEATGQGWGRSVSAFLGAVRARGGEARLAWPACVPRRDSVEYVARIGRAGAAVAAGVGCETLGTADEAVAIGQFFGDTPYHTIPVAAVARTWALIEQLPRSWAARRDGLFLMGWGSTRTGPSRDAIGLGCGKARWLTPNLTQGRKRFVPPVERDAILDHLGSGDPVLFDDPALIPQLGAWGLGYELVQRSATSLRELPTLFPDHVMVIASTTPGLVGDGWGLGSASGVERLAAVIGTGTQAAVRMTETGPEASVSEQRVLELSTGQRLPVRLGAATRDSVQCLVERQPVFDDVQREGTRVIALNPRTGMVEGAFSFDGDGRPVLAPLYRVTRTPREIVRTDLDLGLLRGGGATPPGVAQAAGGERLVSYRGRDSIAGFRLEDLQPGPGRRWLRIEVESQTRNWVDARLISASGDPFPGQPQSYRIPLARGVSTITVPFEMTQGGSPEGAIVGIGRDRHRPSSLRVLRVTSLSEAPPGF